MAFTKKEWIVIGLMSGTSLDGLDIAACRFKKRSKNWEYEIIASNTIPYSDSIKAKLGSLMNSSAAEFAATDAFFAKFSGEQVNKFLLKNKIKADLIASHGHTVFHQPDNGFTSQIGNGAYIAAKTGIPTVSDFRTTDVAYGGQGAPLVPVGDKLLFAEYDFCLNLGGIANISFDKKGKRIAGDICPVNIVLNNLAGEKGKSYDKDGLLAARGKVNEVLLKKLNAFGFFRKGFPKSLGREWIDENFLPVLNKTSLTVEDKLATVCEHIAFQIAQTILPGGKGKSLLITGGGALNKFLVKKISEHTKKNVKVVVPDVKIVSFKEALIFAFLGLKRVLGEANALSSVTGASSDSSGGAVYGVVKK
jgi:anhydro-N-acetylmuramic acid kinase